MYKMNLIKFLTIFFLIISKSYADGYFYKDKEYYYDSHQKILKIIEINKFNRLKNDYQNGVLTYDQFEEETINLKKENKINKLKILKKYKEFSVIEKTYNEKCDYKNYSESLYNDEKFFGLWHLSYINNNKIPNQKKEIAIIDGYMLTNKLLPNLIVKNCDINTIGCKTSWDFVDNSNNVYRSDYIHTYWIASIIAGKNCSNEKSSFQQIGINPMANIYSFNVTKKINNKYNHSLKKTIDAIKKIDEMGIDIIYIPLSFQNYTDEDYFELNNAINNYLLRKKGRKIISVYGNANKVKDKNEKTIPCLIENVICVGGLNQYGAISNNTSGVDYISIYLPSENIIGGINGEERIEDSGVSSSGAIMTGMISKMKNEDEINDLLNKKKIVLEKDGSISKKKSISF